MNLQERIDLLLKLGDYLKENSPELQEAKELASYKNSWFTDEFINLAIGNICNNYLEKEALSTWIKQYSSEGSIAEPKSVGIVMAGNIPLVGFHDFLCVFVSGHSAVIKASSKDEVLITHLVHKIFEWNPETKMHISFAETLKGCDAYIATGSNNSGRYFEYYFGKYPNIIRRNRTSVAILDGTETKAELELLADDVHLYFGFGCRNVTKLYVPEGYDFVPLIQALEKYSHFADFHKYKNNYDYNLALLLMNSRFYMSNESVLLTENASVFSPASQLNYEYYKDLTSVEDSLHADENIQCIVGHNFVPFGKAQFPSLMDYADGIDTMQFLYAL